MDDKIIAALIGFLGGLIASVVTYFSNRRSIRNEIEKLKASVEQEYANRLIEKRLEVYPIIYESLSNVTKRVRIAEREIFQTKISLVEVQELLNQYNASNSKYGVYFSSISAGYSFKFRRFLIELLVKYENKIKDTYIDDEEAQSLRKYIEDLEFSLKNDMGVFLVEFQDARREISLKSYSDLLIERGKRKNMVIRH